MNVAKNSKTFTEKEKEKIEKYLDAFKANFFDPIFYKMPDNAILIYPNEEEAEKPSGAYIQFCENADYCSGFLYGAVVQHNRHFERWTNGTMPEN